MSNNIINNQNHKSEQSNILPRIHLNRIYSESYNYPLTTIVAGAGYGKTQSLLSYLSITDVNVAWIQFSEYDNYSIRFWQGFIQAINVIDKKLGTVLEQQGFPDELSKFHQFLKVFSVEVYSGKPYYLVFDDCHLIQNNLVIKFIENLVLANLENLSIFMISRKDIPIRQANITDRNMIFNIGMDELAFTAEETKSYFQLQNIELSEVTTNQIQLQTEGWPFAIFLVALYLKRGGDLETNPVSYSLPIIFRMIDNEIFSSYPPYIQYHMVKFSLLDNFSLELIKELSGEYLYELIEILDDNMFINYNAHTKQYHFHHLFLEFLVQKQMILKKEEIKEVYDITAKWHESKNHKLDALLYYRKYNNYKSAWNIIWEYNPGRFSEEMTTLFIDTIDNFPSDYIDNNPVIKVIRACLYNSNLNLKSAMDSLSNVITELKNNSLNANMKIALGEAYIMQAFYSMIIGSLDFKEYFIEAKKYLPNGSTMFTEKFLLLHYDHSFTLQNGNKGEMVTIIKTLFEAMPYSEYVLNGSGYGREYLALAEANFFTGNLKKSMEYVYRAIYKGIDRNQADIVCSGYLLLSKISVANGNYEETKSFLKQLRSYADDFDSNGFFGLPDIAEGWFYSRIGHVDKLADWINDEILYDKIQVPLTMSRERLLKGYCLLSLERYHELNLFIDDLEHVYLQRHLYFPLISLYILKAISYHNTGKTEESISWFIKAYEMSYQNNIIMIFIEYGFLICKYLDNTRELLTDIPNKWLDNIYTKSNTYGKRISFIKTKYEEDHNVNLDPVPDLSDREKEILQSLCEGLTREEISQHYDISINAVKYTLKNIYAKLGAINGIDAARIATIKGIIK